jgi:hypothetical protein
MKLNKLLIVVAVLAILLSGLSALRRSAINRPARSTRSIQRFSGFHVIGCPG